MHYIIIRMYDFGSSHPESEIAGTFVTAEQVREFVLNNHLIPHPNEDEQILGEDGVFHEYFYEGTTADDIDCMMHNDRWDVSTVG